MEPLIRILYVDDNPLDRELVRDALEQDHGDFRVTEASSRREFEARLAEGGFDLVLSDFNILGFEGLQVIKAVKASNPNLPVVIVTGTGSEEIAVEAMRSGAADYVIKSPSHIQRLPITIRAVLEKLHLQAEKARDEEAFKNLISSAPIGIFIVQDGKFKLTNPGFQKITGYGEPELLEKDSLILVAPEFQEVVREKNVLMLQGQSITPFEYQFIDKNGEKKWVMASITPTLYGGETVILGYFMDITENKQLEAQFLVAQKMEAVGQLAGGVAHDFNNLLTAILGYSEMLLLDLSANDPRRQYVTEIIHASDRASSLTRQLLAFGRRQILQPRIINLNEVISGMEKMLRRLLGEDLNLVTLLAPDLGAVKADLGQMEQVIMNLAVNARDAMARGGLLTIETENVSLDEAYAKDHMEVIPGPYVMLAVSDTGAGMSLSTQARIFEPFFTTKEAGKGTGLGLSTVHGIVKQSGGHIWVYSEPHKGTTFKVYLPQAGEKAVPLTMAAAPAASLQGQETILVVEDEEDLRLMICQALRFYGYTALEARHGNEAILICARHKGAIDLVLTDVVMPGMSGGELIERLAPLGRKIKVLFMSGYTEDTATLQGLLAGRVHFLEKPFKMTTLVQKAREVLESSL
jgi:PAS domain S-box-containing protein